ncbi:uncharacterized protein EI97DRAFT_427448 [Westerdykella ornata]|uniref:Uncharacterized protein n=1 Tax=Westerdykella ornata TaxID=318751 RepID=A0A6A6J643_WESOR|nr:uncharacterized protein EI97DRAFT_427448 [Westerdykella ornata]KAF2271862.1 hypothetical protein EI97DRAFT_427448 [Westerdykella ornata]
MQPPKSLAEFVLFLIAVGIGCWFAFVGYVLIRLWYYKGALGPQPRRYVILPPYLRDKLLVESSEGSTSSLDDGPEPAHKRRSHGRDDVDDTSSDGATRLPVISVNRWTCTAMVDPNVDIVDVKDETLKRELLEEKRISRMPHFVQDDCGDGRLFPDIPEIDPTLFSNGNEYKLPPFRSDPPKNYMTMGLQKLDPSTWLLVDETYTSFFAARSHLLATKRPEVICTVSGPEVEAACEELLREVVGFLTEAYPDKFDVVERSRGVKVVRNRIVGEEFRLQKPWDRHPLEVCARLAMEDFNILQRSNSTGEHRLVASATLFPAGWRLRDRIGKSVTDLHGPVPLWKGKLSAPVEHYFTRLTRPTSNDGQYNSMQRHTFFIQISPHAASSHPLSPTFPHSTLLFIQSGKDFFPGTMRNLSPSCILVRRERQTFRRLSLSNTVVFTVKTNVERLVDLDGEQRRNLAREIRAWPSEVARYKGRDLWGRVVLGFCEEEGADGGRKGGIAERGELFDEVCLSEGRRV